MDILSIFALLLLFSIGIVLSYGLIIIHDIPYKIAKKRNHPHAEAIEAAGWVSLILMHAIWPFLWIWAMLYQPEKGFGMSGGPAGGGGAGSPEKPDSQPPSAPDTKALQEQLRELESKLVRLESQAASRSTKAV
jgi:hypothetical protein